MAFSSGKEMTVSMHGYAQSTSVKLLQGTMESLVMTATFNGLETMMRPHNDDGVLSPLVQGAGLAVVAEEFTKSWNNSSGSAMPINNSSRNWAGAIFGRRTAQSM